MRALLTLAAHDGGPLTAEKLASEQSLPVKFLENILVDLRRGGLVRSQRGADGGYRLARDASEITAAQILRLIDGPLADVRGVRPEATAYEGPAEHLQEVWVAARASLRSVLENVTLAEIASGNLPKVVQRLAADPAAWEVR